MAETALVIDQQRGGQAKDRPCRLLVKYVEAGWLGRKSGRGFYDYRGEPPVPRRQLISRIHEMSGSIPAI
ncbi:hypothetical protein LPU83_3817 [Rhizobium favelukesii]|uniref:3-hydroxyacyl-CoA dehydrogenase C-terminal domain-containing protein n=1 Tax=Rhizobium favelukesii TaxID=348824 RepID=W6RF44_9HYPH|nr:hypothetical protein LPU83_3817 [Rhizobium favelukesii]